ncbi:MAG TPA: hypothetical protein VGS58_01045 [Candidatus Sulfopaludibacter sp.]|nr:hypothetical protein [Candidatus Sulfopaludibacter sp.]
MLLPRRDYLVMRPGEKRWTKRIDRVAARNLRSSVAAGNARALAVWQTYLAPIDPIPPFSPKIEFAEERSKGGLTKPRHDPLGYTGTTCEATLPDRR